MNKVLKVVLIIFAVLIVLVLIVGIYFYQFHVFKTLRVCVKPEGSDLMIDCSSNQDCLNLIGDDETVVSGFDGIFEQIDNAPDFLSEALEEITAEVLYCDSTCRYREFYGSEPLGEVEVDECAVGEKEIVIKIRGKDGLSLLKWAKNEGLGMAVFDF